MILLEIIFSRSTGWHAFEVAMPASPVTQVHSAPRPFPLHLRSNLLQVHLGLASLNVATLCLKHWAALSSFLPSTGSSSTPWRPALLSCFFRVKLWAFPNLPTSCPNLPNSSSAASSPCFQIFQLLLRIFFRAFLISLLLANTG